MAKSFQTRQTARVFRGFGILLIVIDFLLVVFHAFVFFRAISRKYSDLTVDLNIAALHFVGNTVAVLDLLGGITSYIKKTKQCTVRQVESTNAFLISLFTMYVDSNAIARASLAKDDQVPGFDDVYRTLTILLFVESTLSMAWSVAVYTWSKMVEEEDCEREEEAPLESGEERRASLTTAARRLIASQAPAGSKIEL